MSQSDSPEASQVGLLYDEMHELYVAALGDNLHAGYFEGPLDTSPLEAAQERLTTLMLERIALQPHERMLDVGCGSGRPALRAARETRGSVLGVSVSAAQVEAANARAVGEGLAAQVQFHAADVQCLPLGDATFDAAWAIESLLHVEDRPRALAEIWRVTKPGARLAIGDITADVQLAPAEHAALAAAFRVGFLCSREQYAAEVEAAGFEVLNVLDIGANTLPTLRAMARRVPALEAESNRRWQRSQLDDFLRSFAHLAALRKKLGYLLLAARRRS